MNKEKLDGFINRYSLNGEIDSVMLKSTDDELSVGIISGDKTLRGEVTVKDDKFPVGDFAVYTTSQLQGMLGVLNENIEIDVHVENGKNTSLQFSDTGTTVQYMLAEEKVIPQVPDLKKLPEFDVEITVDEELIKTFGKSKGALKDVNTFTFLSEGGNARIVLGYSTQNSNRISIDVKANSDDDVAPISFNSDYFKAILDANKGAEKSSIEISTAGLCRITFKDGEFNSEYYLVESA